MSELTSGLMRITNSSVEYVTWWQGGGSEGKYADAISCPSEYDGYIRRECCSGSMVTVRLNAAATLGLQTLLSTHPTLIKGVYIGNLIWCDNRSGSDSNPKPNTH